MTFTALVVRNTGEITHSIEEVDDSQLPEGDVTVDVEYSSLNYKDGLCLHGRGGLVRNYPHVPGIDFAGTVSHTTNSDFKVGDSVILTGWRVGESRWGGYASRATVNAHELVAVPEGLTTRSAMALGTAGLAAMLAILALEQHGLTSGSGEVLVTGASGGVGSLAVALLAGQGYEVAAVTGRPHNSDYLKQLGATRIVPRKDLDTVVARPLESETWAGCIDNAGGPMLARVLGQMRYGASIAAVGLAAGNSLPATVIPFLLRAVNLLGIDSVMCPKQTRIKAWARLAQDLPTGILAQTTTEIGLKDLPDAGQQILNGEIRGRTIVAIT